MELHSVESMGQQMGHSKAPNSALETGFRMAANSVLSRGYWTVLQKERPMARLMDSKKVLLTVRSLESQMETCLVSRTGTHLVN
jgi:hypothetical protein